jgi:hypothetical protein
VAGIHSCYSKVYAGDRIRHIDTGFPSQQFNHIILFIPLKEDTVWLDCTSKGAFGYLGTFTQNRNALVLEENNSRFIRTPRLLETEVLESRKFDITYEFAATADIINHSTYRGYMYEKLMTLDESYSGVERTSIMREYLTEEGFELKEYDIRKVHRDSSIMKVSYSAAAPHIFNRYGKEVKASNIPITLPRFEDPEDRKMPLQINYPVHRMDTLIYRIPAGYTIDNEILNQSMFSEFGKYELDYQVNNKSILIIKRLLIYDGEYPLDKYGDFYSFIQEINRIERSISILFTPNTRI